jgi:hypothetical protein
LYAGCACQQTMALLPRVPVLLSLATVSGVYLRAYEDTHSLL